MSTKYAEQKKKNKKKKKIKKKPTLRFELYYL